MTTATTARQVWHLKMMYRATTHITAGMNENQLLSKQELLELMIFEDYTATSQHRCMLNISN
ncbi:MAG: hypothetical protein ACLTC9_06955 [Methanobrevibacter smithii]|uniref:hypothetical protein n=1 Tax=Methanobrevibacter smithii TaxID=2173 RepID=UPI00241BF47C|nr:hypothetical protein [Methanobrevibacter smithii]